MTCRSVRRCHGSVDANIFCPERLSHYLNVRGNRALGQRDLSAVRLLVGVDNNPSVGLPRVSFPQAALGSLRTPPFTPVLRLSGRNRRISKGFPIKGDVGMLRFERPCGRVVERLSSDLHIGWRPEPIKNGRSAPPAVGAVLHQKEVFVSALVARGSHKRHDRLSVSGLIDASGAALFGPVSRSGRQTWRSEALAFDVRRLQRVVAPNGFRPGRFRDCDARV
jgi:hypothetical protein